MPSPLLLFYWTRRPRLAAGLAALLMLLITACTAPAAAPAAAPTETPPPATATASLTASPTPPLPTATETATPAPSPTPTAAPTQTATPAPPTRTATRPPQPTATPQPSPTPRAAAPTATAVPPARFEPPTARQGEIAVLRVRTAPGTSVEGTFEERPLQFASRGEEAWTVVGIARNAPLGARAARVRIRQGDAPVTALEAALTVTATNFPLEDITLPPGQGSLLDPAVVQAEFALVQGQSRSSPPEQRWQGAFLRPAEGPESSPFGIRRSYNGGPPSGSHEGLDIAANTGDPVRAAAAGKVVVARALTVRGNAVLVDHGMGVVTGYYHLSEIGVQEGQDVARGERLGAVGSTGLATGPHLHWDVIVGGVNVDPALWMRRAAP